MRLRLTACLLAVVLGAGSLSSCATKKVDEQSAQASAAATPAEKPKIPLTMRLMAVLTSFTKIIPRKQRPPQALPARQIGEIRQVNLDNRFVLIDGGSVLSIEPGSALVTVSDQRETADLKLTSLRSASFLIADITNGTPSVGDKVFAR